MLSMEEQSLPASEHYTREKYLPGASLSKIASPIHTNSLQSELKDEA